MAKSQKTNRGRCFIFLCFIFIFFLCILASINEVRFQGLLRFGRCKIPNQSSSSSLLASNNDQELRILIAVLTLPDQYLRRHFLRLVYGTQALPEGTKIDVKFVFCNLTKEEQKVMVALEIMRYDDIIILNCTENMNKGKTSTFFRSLPEIFNETDGSDGQHYPPYHYVMKADDDTYVRLNSLVESLKPLPREDFYYGFVIPCGSMDPFKHYMSGMGFLVSWDIVEWIHDSDIPKQHVEGPEDKVFGDWMRWGKKGKNRYNAKWSMYNYPDPPSVCSHDLWPNTIAVHLLKNPEKWIRTLTFFNVTQNLKPSKLYHIS
ncbi:hypothetical protein HN51_002166 [Arachis hypogaea]|uniref:Hexosyltransferase n=2 Tax=Arachis TaxID=3817 RepID=A0A445ENY0_ARAHY|nr:uncharacterized protein LOC107461222 [Arachis duranensis]XP_025607362.1 uncharacterized protein LOC112698248 [Arachis hypogaea]QHO50333.1 Hexosyltransferase [Arachis hypogaea]RYR77023.1 hypothetical protein Ahy_A01g001509 isoform B [Arachis hypogaea]